MMSKQKFDAVVFSEAFKATVQLYQGPFVVFPDQPGICHQLRSERLHLSLRSFARGRGERLNENRIKDVLDELDAFAFEDGLPVVAHYRVAPYLAGYIYNLGGRSISSGYEGGIRTHQDFTCRGLFYRDQHHACSP